MPNFLILMMTVDGDGLKPPGRARAQGAEMTAPGPAWTSEEDGLLRSMGAAGESTTAIATLLKRTPDAVRKRAHSLKIKLARSPPGNRRRNERA